MKTLFRRSFERDLRKIKDRNSLEKIKQSIESVESADDLSKVGSVRKMKGAANCYRIRVGDYRIGLEAGASTAEFVRVLHRRDSTGSFRNGTSARPLPEEAVSHGSTGQVWVNP